MLRIPSRLKPAQGFSHFLHILLNVLLPILVYVFVRIDFVWLAIAVILLSKWRIFAVRFRYWGTLLLNNGVDIMVGISLALFMANTAEQWWQVFWALAYAAWLVFLKPRSDVLAVSAQAMVGQLLGLSALYLKFGDAPLVLLVFGTWLVAYVSAKHFFSSFSESHTSLMSDVWAYFAGALAFVLGHWLLFYGIIAQIVLLLTTIGYGLAALYYLHVNDRLSDKVQRQLLGIMGAIVAIVIVLSDWSGSPL